MARLDLLSPYAQGREAEVFRARGVATDGKSYEYAARRLAGAAARPETYRAIVAAQRLRLAHPHLVRGFGVALPEDDEAGDLYVLSELLVCRDLRTVLEGARRRGNQLAFPVAVHIAAALCAAMEHVAARARLVHGAISPACVLLCASGDVKLAELGVTRHVLTSVLTRKGPWYGPLGYASPEQLGGDGFDARSDTYQIGLLLFEMLAGAPLFSGKDENSLVEAMLRHEVPALPRSRVPAALDELVHVMLSRNPQLRPMELGQELTTILRVTNAPEVSAADIAALVEETPGEHPMGTAPRIALHAPDLRPSGMPLDDANADTGENTGVRLDTLMGSRAASDDIIDTGPTARSVSVPDELRGDTTSIASEGEAVSSDTE